MKKLSKEDKKCPPPRELCTHCYEWCTQSDVGFNDIPQCASAFRPGVEEYLHGYTDKCPCFNDW